MKYIIIFVLTLFSCSANHHYQKALKKGLEPIVTSDTIRINTIDSIPVIKNDTIIYERFLTTKDTIIKYQNVFVPKTRLEIRTEYKITRDTIRLTRVVEKARAKASKQPNYLLWIFLIVVVLAVLIIVRKFI